MNPTISSNIENHINASVVIFDCQGVIRYNNEHTIQLFGIKQQSLVGSNFFDLFYPYESPNLKNKRPDAALWIHNISKKFPSFYQKETWNWNNHGKKVYFSWIFRPYISLELNEKLFIAIGNDHTENKLLMNLMSENLKKLRLIFNSVTDGIVIINLKGEILEINAPILFRFGLTEEQFRKYPDYNQLFIKLIPDLKLHITKTIQQGEITFETKITNIQNEPMIIEIKAKMIEFMGTQAILAVGRNYFDKKHEHHKGFNSAIITEEKERSRIAKELHDGVTPLLSTIKLYVQTLKDCFDLNTQKEIILRIEDTINESIKTVSEISNNLSPHILENFGLMSAIDSFTEKVAKANSLNIEVKWTTPIRFEPKIEITLYRVVTELINNTIKHSGASKIYINFQVHHQVVRLYYSDNGKGVDIEKIQLKSKGMGLYNISNRIKSLNGELKFISESNLGFNVKITIPLINN